MTEGALICLALVVFTWAVLSEWLAARNVTGPLVLLAAGLVLGNESWGLVDVDLESTFVHSLAELTLALLLFADASKVPVASARSDVPVTARLLGIGLPLSILAGTGVALLVFPSLPLALAGLLAASLAPTDAALSAAVLADERIPLPVRRALNVESGLNDGIATPIVTTCIAAAATLLGLAHEHESGWRALVSIAIGIGVGTGLSLAGGRVLVLAHRNGWVQHGARRIGTVWLALAAFLVAGEVGGNPFVAAFIGGLVFGAAARDEAAASVELTELTGSLLSLALWFIVGAGFVLPAFEDLDGRVLLYAAASLTVIRMAPVAAAMLGSGQRLATTLFMGWFGPRGLASAVFGLLALEELGAGDPDVDLVLQTITVTIVLSIVAHGVTARPLTTRYVRTVQPAAGSPTTPTGRPARPGPS
jgi:NhaP-type Na+/H+ or K+/H+ antiporter